MSILAHPQWSEIRQYLRVEAYDRDTNQAGDVRHRIEVVLPELAETRAWLLGIVTACARCTATIHPVRERTTWGTWYYAAACALEDNISCARSRETAAEYRSIVNDLHQMPPTPTTGSLFD